MNKNYKTYLVFLGFTAFLWLAIQFSKTYTEEVTFNIEYENNAIEKVLLPESDTELKLQLEGSGVQLLKFYFLDNSIKLDSEKAVITSDTTLFFTGKNLIKSLEEAIDYKGKISNPSKDTLFVKYDLLSEKGVEIKVKSSLKFKPGYQSLQGVKLDSTTVKVIGPNKILDAIHVIETEELILSDILNDQSGRIGLKLGELPESVKVNFTEVGYRLEVEKLTEGEFKIPVTLVNVDKDKRVQVFPKEVNVIFKVALKDFQSLKASDFEVQASFIENENASLSLKVTKSPKTVFDIRLDQDKVQYIYIK